MNYSEDEICCMEISTSFQSVFNRVLNNTTISSCIFCHFTSIIILIIVVTIENNNSIVMEKEQNRISGSNR